MFYDLADLTPDAALCCLQLQLQRNEVIALMNLLNRLSESVKFVQEIGPTAERIVEGRVSAYSLISSWKRIWSYVAKAY